MDDRNIDQLLTAHFEQTVQPQNLTQLQRSVWQGIAARERPTLITRMLDSLAWGSELRAGPAFAAMVIGIGVGYATLDMPTSSQNYAREEGLGFNIFSSTSTHPLLKASL